MLLQFSVENFLSFRDRVTLSAVPSEHIAHDPKHILEGPNGKRALRVLALYGANASGKSNVLKALQFAQRFITEGVPPRAPIPVQPFKLDKESLKKPSRFDFDFIADNQHWSYGFSTTSQRIEGEWLYRILPNDAEDLIFTRTFSSTTDTTPAIEVGDNLDPNTQQTLLSLLKAARPNQLFLLDSADRNITPALDSVYGWFKRCLHTFSISTDNEDFNEIFLALKTETSHILQSAGTGISKIEFKINQEKLIQRSSHVFYHQLKTLEHEASTNKEGYAASTPYNIQIPFVPEFYHNDIPFSSDEESEGTLNLTKLTPLIYLMSLSEANVFTLDEIERSLHPNLTRFILQTIIESGGTGQLIFTTHDTNLLDRKLLPKDAVWFTEKNGEGASSLYSLAEFKTEQLEALDNTLERGYLQGRFGAVPFLGDPTRLGWREEEDKP
jgi:AAA15 family ATPase/GTPase